MRYLGGKSPDEYPQYCSYCGVELEVEERISTDKQTAFQFLRCPNKQDPRWWNFWTDDVHGEYYIGSYDKFYNFDPMTGEAFKDE